MFTFLRHTGCRPGETAMIEKRQIDLKSREIRSKIGEDRTSGKTGKPRVMDLKYEAMSIGSELIFQRPAGPLFRNMKGHPWNSDSMKRAKSDGGESERPIVSPKWGNHPEGPRGEKGTPCHDTVGGTHGGCIETHHRGHKATTHRRTGYVADFVPSRREVMT